MKIGFSGLYLDDFVSIFDELESTMYEIHEGDYEDEIDAKDRKLLNKVVELSKYIAKEYDSDEF